MSKGYDYVVDAHGNMYERIREDLELDELKRKRRDALRWIRTHPEEAAQELMRIGKWEVPGIELDIEDQAYYSDDLLIDSEGDAYD